MLTEIPKELILCPESIWRQDRSFVISVLEVHGTFWGKLPGGAWVAQSVKHLALTQVMLVSLSPASGSVLTAQSLEPALDSVFPSLSLCLSPAHALSLSLKNKQILKTKNKKQTNKKTLPGPYLFYGKSRSRQFLIFGFYSVACNPTTLAILMGPRIDGLAHGLMTDPKRATCELRSNPVYFWGEQIPFTQRDGGTEAKRHGDSQ